MAEDELKATAELESCEDSLHCYAMLVGFAEATLGFGISLGFIGQILVNARSPFEFLSLEAFCGVQSSDNAATSSPPDVWVCAICEYANFIGSSTCLRCRAGRPDDEFLSRPIATSMGVRQNSCSTEGFTHFLPVYLSEHHFQRDLCARCLQAAWCRVRIEQVPESADPVIVTQAVWHVLPALMNSTAVAMASGDLHTSDVALRGYFNVHRLLLAMATPELTSRARLEFENFRQDPLSREKKACPNLGHFIPRLLLLPDPLRAWADIQEALLRETIDRTVMHAYREYPRLASECDHWYALLRWQSASKGLRMLLFSVCFLKQAARWGSPQEVAAHYDRRCGQATASERDAFREEVKLMQAIDSWEAFSRRWCHEAKTVVACQAAKQVLEDTDLCDGLDGVRQRKRAVKDQTVGESSDDCAGVAESSLGWQLGGGWLVILVATLREAERNSSSKGYHIKAPSSYSRLVVPVGVRILGFFGVAALGITSSLLVRAWRGFG